MINVYFIRHTGKRQPRGYIADVPTNKDCQYVKPFIICQFDDSVLDIEDIISDSTIHLDLDKLMLEYPNTTEEYTDVDDLPQERIVYGYFHEQGVSVTDNCPVITINDIIRDEVTDGK